MRLAALAIGGALLAACGDPPSTASSGHAEPATLPALHVENGEIRDALGRQVLLRGLNHIALRSNKTRPAYRVDGAVTPPAVLFDLQDLEDADFDQIAAFGFNFLRPVFSWEFAQPDAPPAPYNEAYFALIGDFLDKAAAHGLYVVFDFAQFGWSRAAGGNAGAPDWALSDTCRGLPGPSGNAPPQASARVGCAFMEFWQNEPVQGVGLQDLYTDLWREVMRRYRSHPAVVMVDLFNEPYGGLIPPAVLESAFLYPFYRRLAAEIRAIDPDVIIGFQPELYHSLGIPTPATEAIGIENAVYLPHNYSAAYFTQRADPSYVPVAQDLVTRADLMLTAQDATTLGTPMVLGETGWTRTTAADGVDGPVPSSDPDAPPQFARSLTGLADEMRLGWAWFAYSTVDEAYGIAPGGVLDEPLLRAMATPFPRAVGGRLMSTEYDPDARRLEVEVDAGATPPAEFALPLALHYPEGACVVADGAAIARIAPAGGVQVLGSPGARFDASRSMLQLAATPRVTVIEPLTAGCGS